MIGDLLPKDDGAIQQAFDALDASMDAWLEAMSAAQTAVMEVSSCDAASLASSTAVETAPEPSAAESASYESSEFPVASDTSMRTEEVSDSPVSDEPEADTEPQEADPHLSETSDAPSDPPAKASSPGKSAGGQKARVGIKAYVQPGGQDASTADDGPTTDHSDENSDESLLGALDDEVAQAVRIRHRLDPSKSIRELIEEVQAGESSPQGDNAKKKSSWWRRG